jgi:hypothetical protein
MTLRAVIVAAAIAGLCAPASAAGWTLDGGTSPLMPRGHSMFTLTATSGEGRMAAFSCNTIGPHVSFALQVGFGGLTLKDDGYGRKFVVGKEPPVSVSWSVDGKAAGKARWKRSNDFAIADDKSVRQLMQVAATAKSEISFKAASATTTFSAKGIAGLAKMLKSCGQ